MCNLYRLSKGPAEIAKLFGGVSDPPGNAGESVYPGYPGYVMAEGRVGLTSILWFYGRGAYMPDLSDLDAGAVQFTNGSAFEYEFGLQVKPFPFLQLFGGFRSHKDEFDVPLGTAEIKHDGILVGAGVNF